MMKSLLWAALLTLCASAAEAQLRIRAERQQNNNLVFILENKQYPGTLTVFLNIRELENCDGTTGITRHEVRHDASRILTLRPSDPQRRIGCSYTSRTIEGRLDPPVDTALVCRMPCSTLRPVRVTRGVYVLDKYRKPREERQRLATHFQMERGDTVYAVRRGIVTDVRVEQQPKDAPRVAFTTRSTQLRIEHPDGSRAWYVCLDGEHILVEPGEEVLPGTPLALVGTYDSESYKFSVQFSYLRSVKGEEDFPRIEAVPFFPPFLTAEAGAVMLQHGQTYTPVMNDELLTRELSKKELKKLRGRRGR